MLLTAARSSHGQPQSDLVQQSAQSAVRAAADDVVECQFRITWGTAQPSEFSGQILIDTGRLELRQNLSVAADSIGKIRSSSATTLDIAPHSAGTFGGADIFVSAPLTASLTLRLASGEGTEFERTVRLTDLLRDRWLVRLDEANGSLAIQRLLHDQVRVTLPKSTPIFDVSEDWQGQVAGYWTKVLPGRYALQVRLLGGPDSPQLVHEANIEVDERGSFAAIPFQVHTPAEDGVYELEFSLVANPAFYDLRRPEVQLRRIQFIAFDAASRRSQIAGWEDVLHMDLAAAVHATVPSWLGPISTVSLKAAENLNYLNPLGRQQPRPPFKSLLSAGRIATERLPSTADGETPTAVRLPPGSWLALPTGDLERNAPHRLRLRVPRIRSQRIVLAVRPITASGNLHLIGHDFEIAQQEPQTWLDSTQEASELTEHELLFWPGEGGCLILLANSDQALDASIVDITIERAQTAEVIAPEETEPGTLVSAYVGKPLLGQCFAAPPARDPATGHWLENWKTTHVACERLMQWLAWSGANMLVQNIHADGGALTPLPRLAPTPRYDSETLSLSTGVPHIKDSVSLLLRHCERSGIRLVLALDLDTSLPNLPLADSSDETPQGKLYQHPLQGNPAQSTSRRHNPLHPLVQQEIRAVFKELLERYGSSPAFAGIQLELGRQSQLLFVGDRWGYDAAVLEQFAAKSSLDKTDPTWLASQGPLRQAFLGHRAAQVSDFLCELGDLVADSGADRRLYLNATHLWNQELSERDFFEPDTILRKPAEFMLAVGLHPQVLHSSANTVLLQGGSPPAAEHVTADQWIRDTARLRGLQLERPSDARAAALLTEMPQAFRLPAPTALQEHFGPEFTGVLYPLAAPDVASWKNRIMEQLHYSDVDTLIQGTWVPLTLIPPEIRALRAQLRSLPALNFQDASFNPPRSNLRTRIAQNSKSTLVHMINHAPWPERVSVSGSSKLQKIPYRLSSPLATGSTVKLTAVEVSRQGQREYEWELELPAFASTLMVVDDPQLKLNRLKHQPPEQVLAQLKQRLAGLEAAVDRSSDPTQRREVANVLGDFERWNRNAMPTGWSYSTLPGVKIQSTRELPKSGQACLRIENQNQGQVAAWIQSRPFEPPSSGRLLVQAWLRSPVIDPSGKVRLTLVGRLHGGERFQRSVTLQCDPRGVPDPTDGQERILSDWGTVPARLYISDLPTEAMTEAFVSVELLGAGVVWVDDVQVLESHLSPEETVYVRGSMFVAKEQLAAGNPFPAQQLLTSYWGRYLLECQSQYDTTSPPVLAAPNESTSRSTEPARWAENPSMLKQLRAIRYVTAGESNAVRAVIQAGTPWPIAY